MAILVTGATGQVGYRLAEELADAGADATAMVRVAAQALDLPPAVDHVGWLGEMRAAFLGPHELRPPRF